MDSSIFTSLQEGLSLASAAELQLLGAQIAEALPPNHVLALSGPLGAGKTTLVQGLARGLGIDRAVTSPTYNIYHFYQGSRQLLHMDAYRLQQASEIDDLMLEDFLRSPWLIALEWPEKVAPWLESYPNLHLHISIPTNHERHIRILQPPG